MATHPDPVRLGELADAAGSWSRSAVSTSEELLDALALLGDHGTQRALDDAVDAIVAALRTTASDAAELALVLGSQAAAPAPGPRSEPRRVLGPR